jgi:hypothetical protein
MGLQRPQEAKRPLEAANHALLQKKELSLLRAPQAAVVLRRRQRALVVIVLRVQREQPQAAAPRQGTTQSRGTPAAESIGKALSGAAAPRAQCLSQPPKSAAAKSNHKYPSLHRQRPQQPTRLRQTRP